MIHFKKIRVRVASSTPGLDDGFELEVRFDAALDRSMEAGVLFLPFWGGSAATFDEVITKLHALKPKIPMLAVSYAGTGGTQVPADDGAAEVHSIEPRAEQVRSLLATELGKTLVQSGKLVICAHSMSAKISYALLSMLAGDETFEVENVALVLLGPAPVGPLVLPAEMREQQLKAYRSVESARWTIENVLTSKKLDDGTLNGLAEDCAGMSAGAKAGWLKYGTQLDCAAYLPVIKKQWPDLSVSVLVGEFDKVETVERVEEQTVVPLKERGFQAQSRVVEGCGHLLPVEAVDEAVTAILRAL